MDILKKYVSGFFKFWYDFIIGDEWQVAAAILWAFLVTYSSSLVYIQAWYIVPIAVSVLLYQSVLNATPKGKDRLRLSVSDKKDATYLMWGLLFIVLILPELIFRVRTHSFHLAFQNTILPLVATLLALTVCGSMLARPFKKRPVFTIVSAALFCVVLLNIRDKLTILSRSIVANSTGLAWFIVIGCLSLTLYVAVSSLKSTPPSE